MKKVSTLLLTGIIGSSMLFAGFSGSATVESKIVDFSDNSFGMVNPGSEWDATFDAYFSTAAEAKGEGDIYAEINATLEVAIGDADETATAFVMGPVDVEIDYARIVGDGWKVSILGPAGPYDYAADVIALSDNDDEAYNFGIAGAAQPGVAVTLDDLGTVSVGYTGVWTDLTATKGYAAVEVAELEVAEGMVAQAAASLVIDKTLAKNFEVSGSAKLAYTADDYAASVALDAGYDTAFGMDAVMNVAMDLVTLDTYFGTKNTNGDFVLDAGAYNAATNVLHVQAVTDLNQFDVPVTLTVKGLDLINSQDLSAKACVTLSEELAVSVEGGFGIASKAWNVGAGATYTAADYVAKAAVGYNKAKELSASASVESTAIISGATIGLAWADADDMLKKSAATDFGSIVASCTIAF